MKKYFGLLICCISFNLVFAQQDSCNLRISLITCTPGTELYSTFGHSALRVRDAAAGRDIIFNYGTFDFEDPQFYSKFVRGKLLYFVSVEEFENFVYQYEYEQRGITEQVLNLDCAEKQQLLAALEKNAREENKYYQYDFVYDNCTTRLRDIVFSSRAVTTRDIRPANGTTFRNLIHEYLNKSHQYWSKLGIDILLGIPLDKKISNSEAMFLPDYLLKAFDSTTFNSKSLVSGKQEILKPTIQASKKPLLTPFVIFAILFLIIAVMSFTIKATRFFSVFDFILFFLTGALGAFILFMWLGTDHQTCRNNLNLAWAFPGNLVIVFFLFKKRNWVRYYFLGYAILLALLLVFWNWLPQEMNNALIPFVGLLLVRSFIRYKNYPADYR